VRQLTTWQACIPCRRRKVRCDLGSVDNPHDPPCVRCRRESKECYFSATRRKRKHEEEGGEDRDEDYVVRNGRKKNHLGASPPPPVLSRNSYSSVPLTPGGSTGKNQPLRRPDGEDGGRESRGTSYTDAGVGEDLNAQMENLEAQSVMRRGVYGPHDALDLLYKAATDSPHTQSLHRRQESVATAIQPSPVPVPGRITPRDETFNTRPPGRVTSRSADPIDPRLLPSGNSREADREAMEKRLDIHEEPGYEDALKAWSRFRFVRAGWFTREEAIKYIT
jgi:hypothetical protein